MKFKEPSWNEVTGTMYYKMSMSTNAETEHDCSDKSLFKNSLYLYKDLANKTILLVFLYNFHFVSSLN
jgi:hypothetical protein